MLPWDPLWRLRHVGYPVSPRGYRGLPAFASLSMAGSVGELHRLENPGKIPLELIEVQSGSYLGEDDIVRFDDEYGRED